MARRKSELDDRTTYQRVFTALRCAEMVVDSIAGDAEVLAIGQEVHHAGEWDDLVEFTRDGERRYQVKMSLAPLVRADVVSLFNQLANQAQNVHGRLVVAGAGEVDKVGRLSCLDALCEAWFGLEVDVERRSLTAEQERWFQLAVEATNGDVVCGVALLKRLRAESNQTREHLQRQAMRVLGSVGYRGDVAFALLTDLLARSNKGEIRISVDDIQAALRPAETMRVRSLRSHAATRKQYLESRIAILRRMPLFRQGVIPTVGIAVPSVVVGAVAPVLVDDESGVTWNVDDVCRYLASPNPRSTSAVHVSGHVGAGKTTCAMIVALRLAVAAKAAVAAPVPVILAAGRMGDGVRSADWFDGDASPAGGFPWEVAAPKVLIVDGLDEIPPSMESLARQRIEALVERDDVVGVVVTGRPMVPSVNVLALRRLRLRDWGTSQAAEFMRKWQGCSSEAAHDLKRIDPPEWMLANPLMLTFGMIMASVEPASLRGRSRLIRRLTRHVFVDWAGGRGNENADEDWERLLPVLCPIATTVLVEGSVSWADVTDAFGRVLGPRATRYLRAAERGIGLLVVSAAGDVTLFNRTVAEYLSGCDMANWTASEMHDAYVAGWGIEPLRYCLGELDRASARDVIAQFADSVSGLNGEPQWPDLDGWRLVLELPVVFSDVRSPFPGMETLASQLLELLVDETSVWIGDRAARTAREVVSEDGALGKMVRELVRERLCRHPEPLAGWFAGRTEENDSFWTGALMHRAPEVRSVAIARIVPLVDESSRSMLLWRLLSDVSAHPFSRPPGLTAALELRKLDRDLVGVTEALNYCRKALVGGHQALAVAAAFALRPGEADAAKLAGALASARYMYGDVSDVVAALVATDEGASAIEAVWPNWRDEVALVAGKGHVAPIVGSDVAPLTSASRIRLSGVLRDEHDLDASALVSLARRGDPAALEYVCAASRTRPELVDFLWDDGFAGRAVMSAESQRALGAAARVHANIAGQLVRCCREGDAGPEYLFSKYPGLALESLVDVDDEAAGLLASWLIKSGVVSGLESVLAPTAAATSASVVNRRLRDECKASWDFAENGRMEGETLVHLSAGAVTGIMKVSHGAWLEEPILVEGMFKWLETGDCEKICSAVEAFADVARTADDDRRLSDALPAAFVMLFEGSGDMNVRLRMPRFFRQVIRLGLGDVLVKPVLEALPKMPADAAMAGCALACQWLPAEDGANLSKTASEFWPPQLSFMRESDAFLRILVPLAPIAWHDRLKTVLATDALNSPMAVRDLIPLLPSDAVREVVPWLSAYGRANEIPYVRSVLAYSEAFRPADLIWRSLFDGGFRSKDLAAMPEVSRTP